MNDLEYIKSLLRHLEGDDKRPVDSPLLQAFDYLLAKYPEKLIQQYASLKEFITPKQLRTDVTATKDKPDLNY